MYRGVLSLVRLFWGICCFKRSPEEVPYSPSLLIFVALCQWGLASLAWGYSQGFSYGFIAASVYLSTILILPYLVLRLAHKKMRYLQTQTALLGTSLVLNFVAGLVIVVSLQLAQAFSFLEHLILVAIFMAVFWAVSVQGSIYRCALEKPRFVGVLIAIAVLLLSSNVFEWGMRLLGLVKT